MTRKFNILHLAVLAVAALCLVGCYKSVVRYTVFRTAVYIQSTDKGDYTRARDLYTSAYYVDTTDWKVASYEDACNKIITNKLSGERREVPDVYGEMNPSNEYQLSMVINEPMTMMVLVDPANKIYAYRNYELPENLPQVDTKLYIVAWRNSYSTAGWRIINEFYSVAKPDEEDTPADGDDTPADDGEDTPADGDDTPTDGGDAPADDTTDNEDTPTDGEEAPADGDGDEEAPADGDTPTDDTTTDNK